MPPGRLQVVATPIGNIGDMSNRAREALASATLVVAEDTRHTRQLLGALGISRPLVSLHLHNESQRVPELLARLADGAQLVLVSDAGTPL
jgi:16S rRNA (cytidine1402-2'-O)-methyltransferase